MKREYLRQHGKSSLELIEEAFHLLRTAPPAALAAYYVGAVPFVVALLFFWTDMSRSPFAGQHLVVAALGLSLLFAWMKLLQAFFAGTLHDHLSAEASAVRNWRRSIRSLALQAFIQSSSLFVLPLAALIVLPLAWVYAFYQNVTALDDGSRNFRCLFKEAGQQAALWPGQNHMILLVMSGFGFYVFLNWTALCLFAPQLLKMLLGIESPFSQSIGSLLNTTFFAAVFGLTYLCLDPLIKACYVLRCFYGKSLYSGDDLKSQLRLVGGAVRTLAACLILCFGATLAQAAEPDAPRDLQVPPAVSVTELDQAIGEVIQQNKFAWRAPREAKIEEAKAGEIELFFIQTARTIKGWIRAIEDFLDRFFGRGRNPSGAKQGEGWKAQQGLLYLVLALGACALVFFLLWLRTRKKPAVSVESTAIPSVPDLKDENTDVEQLPEDGWIQMGRELLQRGDLRLALRAFYLAGLAHLAACGLITTARFKSNRDYERELQRRGRALPELAAVFSENVRVFDRVWYGSHEVNTATVDQFLANLEKIKAAA